MNTKKYIFSITYKKGYYILTDLINMSEVSKTIGFYTMCKFIKDNCIDFNTVSLPRMSLLKFFRDFAYFDDFEEGNNRL